MAKIWIDGREHEAEPSRNVLEVALSLGYDLPYFCWHPSLGSVGACRQCAVIQYKDEDDDEGKLVMACMTSAADGTRVSIEAPRAREFRASVIEWLMVNHPHDCPVCDEGGECHLQDMTVMTGHNYRRFRFPKRTYRNQDLGPFINHEMNRCIQCYRCVRFYNEYAGGTDLRAFAAHDHVYFGRHEDGPLESEFSGNLVEICPTGVFTDRTLKHHYTRKWDLQTAPSICHHCSLGCNTIPGERYGTLRRIRARYNGEVNGYFLCDRGRYGYEFVNHERRLRHAVKPRGSEGSATALTPVDAAAELGFRLSGRGSVLGIGSPRASVEANFVLRTAVGEGSFYRGESAEDALLADKVLSLLCSGGARSASLSEVENADAVLVLGEDATNTAPMLALALRQAVRTRPLSRIREDGVVPAWHDLAVREAIQDTMGPLFMATPTPTKLDAVSRTCFRGAPEDIARLGRAVARELDAGAERVPDLDEGMQTLAREIAEALGEAERPLVVSGTSLKSEAVLDAAAAVADALVASTGGRGQVFLVLPECNTLGSALLGGATLDEAFRRVEKDGVEAVVILENDLFRRAPRDEVERFLDAAPFIIVLDGLAHETGERADLVLPAATFAEGDGTLVSNEGRAQRYFRVFVPEEGDVRESWRWMVAGANAVGFDAGDARELIHWKSLGQVHDSLARILPAMAPIVGASPDPGFRVGGARVPREPHRYSGRTAMRAERHIHEPPPPDDPDSPLSFSMEGYQGEPPPQLAAHFWSPGWNSIQALNRFQEEVGGPLRGGDPGVRLLEPSGEGAFHLRGEAPAPFRARHREKVPEQEWRAIPLYHCFGSEELSVLSKGVAEHTPPPYVALSSADADSLGVEAGGTIVAELRDGERSLPVRILSGLPSGCAGVPVGLPGLPRGAGAEWIRIRREGAGGKEEAG